MKLFTLHCHKHPFFAYILHRSLFVVNVDTNVTLVAHNNIVHNPSDIAFISSKELVIVCNRTYYLIYNVQLKKVTRYSDFTHTIHQTLPPLHDYFKLLFRYPYGNIRYVYDENILITTDKKKAIVMNLVSLKEKTLDIDIYHYSLIYANANYIAIHPSTKNDNSISIYSLKNDFSHTFPLRNAALQVNMIIIDSIIAVKSVCIDKQPKLFVDTYSIKNGELLGKYETAMQDGIIKKMENMILLVFPEKITVLNKTCQICAESCIKIYMTNDDNFIVCCENNKINVYNKFLQNLMSFDSIINNVPLKSAHICNSALAMFDAHNRLVIKHLLYKQYWCNETEATHENVLFALMGCMMQTHTKIAIDNIMYDTMSYLAK